MPVNVWVENLFFMNGTNLSLKKDSIVVFVGPNNGGKSRTLKEIANSVSGYNGNALIVAKTKVGAVGTEEELFEHIKGRLKESTYYYPGTANNSGMDGNTLKGYWKSAIERKSQNGAPAVGNFFVKTMDTTARLSLVSPPGNIDVMTELINHPIQILKDDTDKELLFSDFFKKAFNNDVIVNHSIGAQIPLHVGLRPPVTAENDRVSKVYQTMLRTLPFLHEQGDGMKSFAGVFLSLFAENYTINMIDEPEAFLHPPQAALLGQMVGQKLSGDKQIFVATHSEHFLKGLLDTAADRLVVVRIERDGNVNHTCVLDNTKIASIWKDSLLRYSNILDGLFHKRVVLVESDSDCLFYNAIMSTIVEANSEASPDILFVSCGGKHRFPVVIKALKSVNVPLTVFGDFDLYHDENPLRYVYQAVGGVWDDINADFLKVKKAIDTKLPELKVAKLRKEVDEIFIALTEPIMPDSKIKAIQSALAKASPWKQAKATGAAYLPAGEAVKAFKRIQEKLGEKNVIVLEVGEIEAFDKTIGGHGPKWVSQVLEKDLLNTPDLREARDFVKKNILS